MHDQDDKTTFDVARNVRDPAGTALRGVAPGYDLTRGALGHPQLLWLLPLTDDLYLEADVFAPPGEPMYFYINCPVCLSHGRKVQLRVSQDHKPFSYEVNRIPPVFPGWTRDRMRHEITEAFVSQGRVVPPGLGGTLTLADPIRCTFEADPSLRRTVDPLCPWRVTIINNIIRSV